MKVKNIGEEKEPTAQKFIEALKTSGKQIDVRRIPEPNGFGTGMESYPPEIEVGVVIMEGNEYTLTVRDLVNVINQIATQE